jgi:ABC-type sugar transport system permease subunit
MIYEEAFDRFRYGNGSVLMVCMFAITLGLVLVVFLLFRGWGHDEA